MEKIFLGGTCNNSTWREELIPKLTKNYFNPVVEDWTPECQVIEEQEKRECNIHLYVITKEMTGVYSIAEIIDSAWDISKDTFVQLMPDGFNPSQLKSLEAVLNLAHNRGANIIISNKLDALVEVININDGI